MWRHRFQMGHPLNIRKMTRSLVATTTPRFFSTTSDLADPPLVWGLSPLDTPRLREEDDSAFHTHYHPFTMKYAKCNP